MTDCNNCVVEINIHHLSILSCSHILPTLLFPFSFFLSFPSLWFHNLTICPSSSHMLSSRGAVAFGGWHGGRRWAWARWVHRGPPSLPVALFPLPGASCLSPQERLSRWPPGHGLGLQRCDCSRGQADPWQQEQAEEKVCKSDHLFSIFFPPT